MKRLAFLLPWVVVGGALFAAEPAPESPVKLGGMTAEHERNPMGIGVAMPRLSWKLVSQRAGEVQTGYEVRAASTAGLLGGVPDLFDTGKVASGESVLVDWPGKELSSRGLAYWQVRVWDKEGKASAWSEAASIEMGVLDVVREWKGQWITADLPRVDMVGEQLAGASWINAGSTANQAAAARVVVELPAGAKVVSAVLDANADGLMALYVNGLATKQGASSHTAPFHADFPQQLAAGRNVIGVFSLAVRNSRGGGRNALAARGVIELEGGRRIELVTDGTWKAAVAPAGNWFAKDYDDSGWAQATVLGAYKSLTPVASADSTVGPGRYLRKAFVVSKAVAKARLYATALGTYEATINGKAVNDHQLDPGWTDYAKRVMVQTTDVTGLIVPGRNVAGAVLADGWFAGRLGWQGLGSYARVSAVPVFNAQIVLTYVDGTTETVGTDGTWKGGGGAVVGSDQQLGEVIDGRRGAEWNGAGFDDGAWKAAVVRGDIATALVPQLGPPVRALMELSPVKITRVAGLYVVDFGQNMVGHVRLKARGAAGAEICLQHGEMLNADGTIYNENLRQAIALDRFILRGDAGGETFEPRFTFHGFRYVQIAGYPGELTADAIRGIVVGSDTPDTGTFECSSADINRLWQNIRWGQRGNFLSIPTDCPQRDERMGWMGDAQVFAPTAARNADVAGFFTKWMVDVVDGQHGDGQFNNVNPVAGQTQSYPVWADAGVVVPWEMYLAYGDKGFLARNYAAMCRWVDYGQPYPTLLRSGGVGDHLAPTGGAPGGRGAAGGGTQLGHAFEAIIAGDAAFKIEDAFPSGPALTASKAWHPGEGLYLAAAPARGTAPGTRGFPGGFGNAGGRGPGAPSGFGGGVSPTNIVDTAYFAHSAWIVSQAAGILGKPEDAAKYKKLFEDICAAFNKAYVNGADGTINGGTQTCYVLALEFNLLPENLRAAAGKHLTDDIEKNGHLTTGFVGVGLINPALTHMGRADVAYQLLFTDTYPSWLYTIRQGATTMWERWDGYVPGVGFQASSMNSFNHYSLGSVGMWLYSGAGGISLDPVARGFNPGKPGYKSFSLMPQFTDRLTWVKATQETPYGTIAAAWRRENGQYTYEVTIPPNSSATVYLPVFAEDARVNGERVPSNGDGPSVWWSYPAGTYRFTFAAAALERLKAFGR